MNKDKTIPLAASAVVVLLLIGGLIYFYHPSAPLYVDVTGSQASTTTTGATTTSMQATSTGGMMTSSPVGQENTVGQCVASDLDGSASWQGAGGSLIGSVVITNRSKTQCSIPNTLTLQFLSGNVSFPASQKIEATSVSIDPSQKTTINFNWSNWCGSKSSFPFSIEVIFTSVQDGYLLIPVIGPNGVPESDIPSCENTKANSQVTVTSL